MGDNNRIDREKKFHNERFSEEKDKREIVSKYYVLTEVIWEYYYNLVKKYCPNKNLLDYGAGIGESTYIWLNAGAKVTGIDISYEGLKKAQKKIIDNNFANFLVMDCEKLGFRNETFDIVSGTAILHHLNTEESIIEIARVLKKNGKCILVEPLGHNIFINLYRKLTPNLRTIDEHPLLIKDMLNAKKYFNKVEIKYFNSLTLLYIPLIKLDKNRKILSGLYKIENYLIKKFSLLRRLSWNVVIELQEPLNNILKQ
jgi:ubiquinone/menaquinone biosynthesis C-methylase UbiE